jgi:hypothetical protein
MNFSRAVSVACLLAVPLGWSAPNQLSAVAPSARVIPPVNGQPVSVLLPLTGGRSVDRIVHSIANSVSAPVGIEYVESGLPLGNRVVQGGRTVLTGLRLSDALNLLADAGFTWQDGAVVHVSTLHTRTFLDTSVQSFEATNANFDNLLPRIHALVDPQFPPPSEFGSGGSVGCKTREDCLRGLDVLQRKFSFRVEGGTVRDVLDRAVLAHGEASWVVQYGDDSGTHVHSDIRFFTFAGFTVQLSARGER